MTTTTSYGTWDNVNSSSSSSVEDSVAVALSEFAADYDLDGLVVAYREAINAVLPKDISLNGNEFYGPYPREAALDLAELVESVDFWTLSVHHDRKVYAELADQAAECLDEQLSGLR